MELGFSVYNALFTLTLVGVVSWGCVWFVSHRMRMASQQLNGQAVKEIVEDKERIDFLTRRVEDLGVKYGEVIYRVEVLEARQRELASEIAAIKHPAGHR